MKKLKKKRKIIKVILTIFAIFFAMIVIHYILNSSDKIYLARLGVNAEYVQEGKEIQGSFFAKTVQYKEYRDIDNDFTFRLYRRNQMFMKKYITDTDYYFYKRKNEMYHQLDSIAKEYLDNEYYIELKTEPSRKQWKKRDIPNVEYHWIIVSCVKQEQKKTADDIFLKIEKKYGKKAIVTINFFDNEDKYNDEMFLKRLKGNSYLPDADTILHDDEKQQYNTVVYSYQNYINDYEGANWIYGIDKKQEETTEK